MSNEQANLSLMRRLYEDYGRGETGSLFDALSEGHRMVEHASTSLPWGGEWSGEVGMRDFIETVGRELDHQAFAVEGMIASGETVAAWGYVATRCRKSGRSCHQPWMHRITLHDGKIVEFHEFYDSLAIAEKLGRI